MKELYEFDFFEWTQRNAFDQLMNDDFRPRNEAGPRR